MLLSISKLAATYQNQNQNPREGGRGATAASIIDEAKGAGSRASRLAIEHTQSCCQVSEKNRYEEAEKQSKVNIRELTSVHISGFWFICSHATQIDYSIQFSADWHDMRYQSLPQSR